MQRVLLRQEQVEQVELHRLMQLPQQEVAVEVEVMKTEINPLRAMVELVVEATEEMVRVNQVLMQQLIQVVAVEAVTLHLLVELED